MRWRLTNQPSPYSTTQRHVVSRQHVICAHVGQEIGENLAQLHVVQISLLDALAANAVSGVCQQIRL